MRQVTYYSSDKEDLQFAIDQIEMYTKGVIEIQELNGMFAVFRTDLKELKS